VRYLCLLLDLGCLLDVFLGIFFLIGSDQFLCLVLEDFDFIIELFLLLFKGLDLDIKIIECSLDFDLFLGDFFSLRLGGRRRRGWGFLLISSAEQFVKE
jgi:hypothetical protein